MTVNHEMKNMIRLIKKLCHFRRTATCLAVFLLFFAIVWLNLFAKKINNKMATVISSYKTFSKTILSVEPWIDGILLVDSGNNLSYLKDGKIIKERKFNFSISAVYSDPERDWIYLASSSGKLYKLNSQFSILKSLQFPGRISDLDLFEDGRLAVCYGKSAYGTDYYICIVDPNLFSIPFQKIRTNYCTKLLKVLGGNIAYSTFNSKLSNISVNGNLNWEKSLSQPPISFCVFKDKQLLAIGDKKGFLNLLNSDGELVWQKRVSKTPLNIVKFSDYGDIIITLNKSGKIFAYNFNGKLIWESVLNNDNEQPIVGVVNLNGQSYVFGITGLSSCINISQVVDMRWVVDFRVFQKLINVILIAILAFVIIHGNSFLRSRTISFFKKIWQSRTAYILLLPTIILLLIFNYYPVVTAFCYSFTNFSLTSVIEFTGLKNFRIMLNDPYFWIGIKNMFIFLITGLIKTLTVPLLIAELVFRLSNDRLKQFLRTSFVLPTVIPGVVFVLLWKMIYSPYDGFLNKLLEALGLSAYAHAWLAEEKYALWSIVFAGFPWVNAFAFLIFLGGLIAISKDIYEAAEIDGISGWNRFFKIDIPLLKPQIKLLVVFTFIGSIQDFTSVLIFTGGGPNFATYVPALHMFYQISEGANIGYACAIGVVLFAIIFTATLVNMNFFKTYEA